MARRLVLFATIAVIPCLTFAVPAAAQQKTRTVQEFTTGWRFLQADAPGAEKPEFDDSGWTRVTLPHDWSIAGPFKQDAASKGAGAFAPTGIGWYRKTFTVPDADASPTAQHRTYIVFDGVMANSDVYLNGQILGHRPYGYVSFYYELTSHLRPGANTIAVRVDDSKQPASRWYSGAGIYREVRLVTVNDIHIVPWGTFVSASGVTAASATVHVRSTVTNETATGVKVLLRIRITGPNGTAVEGKKDDSSNVPLYVSPGASADLDAEAVVVKPDRWDLNHGVMYTAHSTILRDGKVVDEEDVPFGIREFTFDAAKGFFLNGVHHKVNGVALHADGGAVGAAVPLAVWERRLKELRSLGVNAIRTAHNPPAPEFLDLADRMGFLVMDEMFDCWTFEKNPYDYHLYFKDWALRDTTDAVMRDRNHPSIILWSLGNEVRDTPHPEIAVPILLALLRTVHANDITRPVTQALFRPNASHDYDDGFADLLDVIGQNYREQELLAAHAQRPIRKIIGTENSHDHKEWIAMRDHPEYSGQFLWSGIDYLGESAGWPAIGSGSGLLNSVAIPHGLAYERQSWWSTTPMVAMVRRVGEVHGNSEDSERSSGASINQPPTSGATQQAVQQSESSVLFHEPLLADWTPKNLAPHDETVEVYTNAQEVELLLNGKQIGTDKLHADASPMVFKVPFAPGTLRAVARTGGKIVATQELKTAGKPARIVLTSDSLNTPLTPDWNDVRFVTATLVDDAGTRIPDSTTTIHFATTGPASIIAVDNGDLRDLDPFQATQRKVYLGNAVSLVRATASSGPITVTASADGVQPASVMLNAASIDKEDSLIARPESGARSF